MTTRFARRAFRLPVMVAVIALFIFDGLAIVFHNGATAVTVGQAVKQYQQSVTNGRSAEPDSVHPQDGSRLPVADPSAPGPTAPSGSDTTNVPSGPAVTTPSRAGGPSAAATPAAGAAPAMPTGGVYVYDTSGYEQLSTPGSRRSFPSQTTITVTDGAPGCQVLRWEPFQQHWEQYDVCYEANNAVTQTAMSDYVSFYGVSSQSQLECPPPSNYWKPPTQPSIQSWTFACTDSSDRYQSNGSVIGTQTLDVGGQQVSALHLRFVTTISGSEQGQNEEDMWLATSSSLPLKLTGTTNVTESSGSFGDVTYQEQFAMSLESLQPQT